MALPTSQQALWDCAMECALRQQQPRKYKCRFDSPACSRCNYYIKNYIDVSPSQAKLYMMQANKHAGILLDQNKLTASPNFWVITIFIIAVGFLVFLNVRNRTDWPRPSTPTPVGLSTLQDIHRTLAIVGRNRMDVDGDGLINCIDATVLFYHFWTGDRRDIRIIHNINPCPAANFNHLFIMIFLGGSWRGIEPQAAWRNHSIWMVEVWCSTRYIPRYNVNATAYWRRYTRRIPRSAR